MPDHIDVEDIYLNYDPEFPQERFLAAGYEAAIRSSTGRLPGTVPWPEASKPTAAPLAKLPAETDDLTRFAGYDAVVVTWTAAEAAALAAMFVPDYLPSRWYEYRHGVANYVPLVTGGTAPFNDKSSDMARYYHSLGLYFPCTIGEARVLLFKSGLHLDYDGPQIPVRKLMAELAAAVRPKLFITTGTGGGIGKQVALGDVVIAAQVKFDCTTQFKTQSWARASFPTAPLPAGAIAAISPDLTRVNAARVVGGRKIPKIWSGGQTAIVTTDFFGFDDFDQLLQITGVRPSLRYGRCDGRRRTTGIFRPSLLCNPQCVGPANSRPFRKHQGGQADGRRDLHEIWRFHHGRECDRELGGDRHRHQQGFDEQEPDEEISGPKEDNQTIIRELRHGARTILSRQEARSVRQPDVAFRSVFDIQAAGATGCSELGQERPVDRAGQSSRWICFGQIKQDLTEIVKVPALRANISRRS